MNFIITGFFGSGSSAVFDLLEEYSCNTTGFKDGRAYEHTTFYTPGGLFDLEDKLFWGNDLHRSDEAILTFKKEMKRLNDNNFGWFGSFKNLFSEEFEKMFQSFLNDLPIYEIQSSYYGRYKKVRFSFIKVFLQLGAKLIQHRTIHKWGRLYVKKPSMNKMYVCFPNKEEFFSAGRKFVSSYMNLFKDDFHRNVIFDRLILCHNLYRIPNYFDDNVRVIVVHRDVRDIYFLNKYLWPQMHCGRMYPTDLNKFIDYWKHMNQSIIDIQDKRILHVQFEDLIYNFNRTVEIIEKHCNLRKSEHVELYKYFEPERSINNTQVFKGHSEWEEEIRILEHELSEYLYSFPYDIQCDKTKMFDDSRNYIRLKRKK